MNYHLTITGEYSSLRSLADAVSKKKSLIFINTRSNSTHDLLVQYAKFIGEVLFIEIVSFNEIANRLISSIKEISSSYSGLQFKLQYINPKEEFVAGFRIERGQVSGSFKFDNKKDICSVIQDYLCSLHVSNIYHASISTDGVLLSELTYCEKTNESTLHEERIIHFLYNESLLLSIKYGEIDECDNDTDPSYRLFGLSQFIWSAPSTRKVGRLHELIGDNFLENFFHIVGFRFALEFANDNGMNEKNTHLH